MNIKNEISSAVRTAIRRSELTKSAQVYSDINLPVSDMEKTSGFVDWFADNVSRPVWGGLGVAAANIKYVADGVGNVPRAFGAKENWWGDNFQSSSWKDYNKAGWEVGKGSADVMAGGLAKGLTLGLSDTINDAADYAAVQSERNLNGNKSADRAQRLLEMRRYYRDNGPAAFQQQYGSADPELLEAFSKGDTGLSDDVLFALKGSQIAGNIASIPLGNAAVGAAGKSVGALAGTLPRVGGAAARWVNGAAQASRVANTSLHASRTANTIGRAVKPVWDFVKPTWKPLGEVIKRIWDFATKYRASIAGAIGVGKGVKDGVSSGSVTQGIESGLNSAATSYLLTGGPWKAFVPMTAVGDSVGEYGRTGSVMDSLVAGSQGASRNSLFGKAFNVAPGTTMAATLGVPAVGVVKKYNTLQDSLQRADDNNAVLKERDAILSGENIGGGGYDGDITRDDMFRILEVIPEERASEALANWVRRLHSSRKYDELNLNDLRLLKALEEEGKITTEERNQIGWAIYQRARQAEQ